MKYSILVLLILQGLCTPSISRAIENGLPPIVVKTPPLDTAAVAALTRRIESTIDGQESGELLDDRASEYGRSGLWQDAANDFRSAAEADPNESRYWMRHGVALLLARNVMQYGPWVEEMTRQFEGTDDHYAIERVAKMCVLSKIPVGGKDDVLNLADLSVRRSQGKSWSEYFPSTQAIARYRFEDYKGAMEAALISDRINQESHSDDVTAINRAVVALCHIKQGNQEEAQKLLKQVNAQLREIFADSELVRTPGYWHDWMIAKILYDEAIESFSKMRGESH